MGASHESCTPCILWIAKLRREYPSGDWGFSFMGGPIFNAIQGGIIIFFWIHVGYFFFILFSRQGCSFFSSTEITISAC